MVCRISRRPAAGIDAPLRFVLDATSLAVRCALGDMVEALRRGGVSLDACGTVETVLAEALNNVVEHAYPREAHGSIEVLLILDGTYLHCQVSDEGRPLPPRLLPLAPLAEVCGTDVDDLPEGGFGWFLIQSLCEDLGYSRQQRRNRLTFSIRL